MRQVDVGRFVSFVERLRSLSCLVDSFHLLNSLFTTIIFHSLLKIFSFNERTVLIRCYNNFICCPLHRSFTELHGRCPCSSVLIRCYHHFVCCREIHSLNAGVHCLVALIRFVVKIIVLFNTNSVRC